MKIIRLLLSGLNNNISSLFSLGPMILSHWSALLVAVFLVLRRQVVSVYNSSQLNFVIILVE